MQQDARFVFYVLQIIWWKFNSTANVKRKTKQKKTKQVVHQPKYHRKACSSHTLLGDPASYLVCWEIQNSAPAAVKMSNAGLGKGEGRIGRRIRGRRRRTGKNLQQYTCERLSCLTTAYHISCSFRLSPSRQNNQPLHNHRDSHIGCFFPQQWFRQKHNSFWIAQGHL